MRLASTLVLLTLAGCVSASTTSAVNRPALTSTFVAAPILVWFPDPDLALRTEAEASFVAEIAELGAEAVPGNELLFPGRDYTAAEIIAAARQRSISSILLVSILSASQARLPATGLQTCVQTDAQGRCQQSVTTTAAPRGVPGDAVFQFTLYDAAGDLSLWTATIETTNQGGAAIEPVDMVTRAMRAAAQRLQDDGLLGP